MAVLKYKDPTTGKFVELPTGSTDKRLLLELIPDATGIDGEADLNTIKYLKVGKFVMPTDADVLKLKNCPTSKAFTMWVFSPLHDTIDKEATGTWQYRVREIRTYEGDIYIQKAYVGDTVGNWVYSSWKKMASTSDNVASANLANKLECINGRITNANITHSYENDKAHLQLLLATSSMTSNKPASDGYILHCSWDNDGQYNGQLFIPNNASNIPLQFRGCNDGDWGSWEDIHRCKVLYDNSSGTTGTVTLKESAANFTYLEIFFRNDINQLSSNKFFNCNGKPISLSISTMNLGSTYTYYQTSIKTVNNTTITTNNSSEIGVNYNKAIISSDLYNGIFITRVVGYR